MRSQAMATIANHPIPLGGNQRNSGVMRLVKSSSSHPYTDPLAFERLMLLIATLARHPGVGSSIRSLEASGKQNSSEKPNHRNSGLQAVKAQMQILADRCGLDLPNYSIHTLRKDLDWLKRFQILDRRRYCQGYFLGIGALGQSELQLVLDGLATLADIQQDGKAQQAYQQLRQRLKGTGEEKRLFYPVRSHQHRAVVCTHSVNRRTPSRYPETLFQRLDQVEAAILQGQALELQRIPATSFSRHNSERPDLNTLAVWPLQLLYHNGIWHLLYERFDGRHLAIERIDCLHSDCKVLKDEPRGLKVQQRSLKSAYKLLDRGWGIHLGEPGEQRLERQGKLAPIAIAVRLFGPAAAQVMLEDRRHPSQIIQTGPRYNGQLAHIDYRVQLPPRSLPEFSQWIYGYGDQVQVLSPPELLEQHRRAALSITARYRQMNAN